MENCLVTKFKADTNNNNLPFLDWYKVYFKSVESPSDKSQGLRGVTSTSKKLKVLGSIHFTDSTLAENLGTEINNGLSGFYVSNGNGVLLISRDATNILAVSGATTTNKAYYLKLDEYADSESLTGVAVRKSDSEGSIMNLVKNVGLTILTVLECPNVTGEIIDFVISQIDNYGRTSGELRIEAAPSGVTLENNPVYGDVTVNYVSASQFTYTYQAVTTTYNKVNDVWTKQV